MPKPKRPAEGPATALVRLTNAEIVRRIFPEVSIDVPDGIPGRSWIAGRVPPKSTELDEVVGTLLKRTAAPRILSLEELDERGIDCPYYAVRFFTVLALLKAGQDYRDYDECGTNSRITILKNQKRELQEILVRSRKFAGPSKIYTYKQVMQVGDPNWNFVDDLNKKRDNVKKVGAECFEGINDNIKRIQNYLDLIEEELVRISPGKRRPETWRYSFIRIMGGLYCTLIGVKNLPDDGDFFNIFLTAATSVVGGDNATIEDWGQARTLIKQFKNAPPGEGFDEGMLGAFSLKKMEMIEKRGPDIRGLYDISLNAHRRSIEQLDFLKMIDDFMENGGDAEKEMAQIMVHIYHEEIKKDRGINSALIIGLIDMTILSVLFFARL